MDVFNIKAKKIKPKKTLLKHKLGTSVLSRHQKWVLDCQWAMIPN
jgi:hypothetical protein